MKLTKTNVLMAVAMVAAMLCAAEARAGAIWYNTQSDWSSDSHLYSYDLASGQTTDRGTISGLSLLTDIAFNSRGTLFGVGWANSRARGSGKLYAITPGGAGQSATYTEISLNRSITGSVNGLASWNDQLYVSSSDKRFYRLVEEGDGSWTVATSDRGNKGTSGDLAIGLDGTAYATVINGRHTRLATVNIDHDSRHFGKSSYVGHKTDYENIFGLGMADDTLYGLASQDTFGNSELVSFDTTTGQTTAVASLGGPAWGMAVAPTVYGAESAVPPEVPEPSTLGLLIAGAVGMLARKRRKA